MFDSRTPASDRVSARASTMLSSELSDELQPVDVMSCRKTLKSIFGSRRSDSG